MPTDELWLKRTRAQNPTVEEVRERQTLLLRGHLEALRIEQSWLTPFGIVHVCGTCHGTHVVGGSCGPL